MPSWLVWQFSPDGRLETATTDGSGSAPITNYFVVGQASRSGASLIFSDHETALGLGVKRTGALFRIPDVAYYESKMKTAQDEEDEGEEN
ncbi:hypothetical protein VDG1235_3132 [Verrucomicrobiia bacterium DG1235]|nr:hypothetical protein VDG1235_3132 [Verrucomicrobiae bacterium DG1235]